MGVTSIEKAEVVAYKLIDVAKTWYVQWRDNRELRGGLMTFEIFMRDFLGKLFPIDLREDEVE